MGLGSHCQVTEQPSRQAWKGRSPRNRGIWLEVEGGPGALRTGWTCLTRSAGSWRESKERTERRRERSGKARAAKTGGAGGVGGQGEKTKLRVGARVLEWRREKGKAGGTGGGWGPQLPRGLVGGGRGGPPLATHAGLSYTTRQCTHSSRHMLGAPCLPSFPAPPVLQRTGPGPSLASECGAANPRPQPPVLMERDRRRKNTV